MTATPTTLRERIESLFNAIREDAIYLCSSTPAGRSRDPDPAVQREIDEVLAALSARDAAGAVGEPFLWIDPRQFDRVRRFANDPHVVGRRYAPAWLKKYDDDYIPLFLAALATPPASGEAGVGVQICTFADCTCDALHTTTSGEPIDHAAPTPLRERHAQIAAMPLEQTCGGRMSHDEVASKVRMLMRSDLDHEAVCTIARDRIAWLAGRVAELEAALSARDAAGVVGAIDETGEPYLYLSTDLPRGTLLYAEPPPASACAVGGEYHIEHIDTDHVRLTPIATPAVTPGRDQCGHGIPANPDAIDAYMAASGEAEELAALLERLSSHSLVGAANYGDARGTAICTRAAALIRRLAAVAPAADLATLADALVKDWDARGRMPQMAWDFRGFAEDGMRRALAAVAPAGMDEQAQETFRTWFCLNYPGPHTIISDPNWHAPRIFRQALWAMRNATPPATAGQE